jgi:hypothetical protein
MATLGVLSLAGCPVRDPSVVFTLPRLHYMNLHNTPLTDLGDLSARLPRVTFDGVKKPASDKDTSDDVGCPSERTHQHSGGGDDVDRSQPADVLAEFRMTQDFAQRWNMIPALVATRNHEAVQEAVRHQVIDNVTLTGLCLQGGAGDIPFPPNPWNVPADAGGQPDGRPLGVQRIGNRKPQAVLGLARQ